MELTISKEDFDNWQQPCVYQVVREKEILYVGVSAYGINRVFGFKSSGAGQPHRAAAFKDCDKILVTFYLSIEEAQATEDELIHRFHPKGNRICALCGNSWDGVRIEQKSAADTKEKTSARWLKLAGYFVQRYGGIPNYQWLVDNGFGKGFFLHVRSYPGTYVSFPRVTIPSRLKRLALLKRRAKSLKIRGVK